MIYSIKRIFIYSSLIILVYNCGSQTDNYIKSLIVEKYPSGSIKSEIQYLNDSIKHGFERIYYDTTKILMDENEYDNGEKSGWQKHYRRNGTLQKKMQYLDGQLYGYSYFYHEDGDSIKTRSLWFNGAQFGDAFHYYQDGKLRFYKCIDFFNDVIYAIKWDSQGVKIKEEGCVFGHDFLYDNVEPDIKKGDFLIIQIAVPSPPETRTNLEIGQIGESKRKLQINNNKAVYTIYIDHIGMYNIIVVGTLYDMTGNILKKDSISAPFTVFE